MPYYQTYMADMTIAQQGLFVILANITIGMFFYILNWIAGMFEA